MLAKYSQWVGPGPGDQDYIAQIEFDIQHLQVAKTILEKLFNRQITQFDFSKWDVEMESSFPSITTILVSLETRNYEDNTEIAWSITVAIEGHTLNIKVYFIDVYSTPVLYSRKYTEVPLTAIPSEMFTHISNSTFDYFEKKPFIKNRRNKKNGIIRRTLD